MTTSKQAEANRRNARRSTGPRTPEGKDSVRLNALRHGLLARDLILPDEDADAFEDLRNAIHAKLRPVGPVEELLADRVVNAVWRLRRLERVEAGLFTWGRYTLEATRAAREVGRYEEGALDRLDANLNDTVITNKTAWKKAQAELSAAHARRDADENLLGRAFREDAGGPDAFGKLARYEAGLERTLLRCLNEVRRLQDARTGEEGNAAPAVDAEDVSVGAT